MDRLSNRFRAIQWKLLCKIWGGECAVVHQKKFPCYENFSTWGVLTKLRRWGATSYHRTSRGFILFPRKKNCSLALCLFFLTCKLLRSIQWGKYRRVHKIGSCKYSDVPGLLHLLYRPLPEPIKDGLRNLAFSLVWFSVHSICDKGHYYSSERVNSVNEHVKNM